MIDIGFVKRVLHSMRHTILVLIFFGMGTWAWANTQPQAQQQAPPAPPLRIAIVSVSTLLDQAPQSRAASMTLKNEFGKREEALVAIVQQLEQDEDNLERNYALAEAERVQLGRELRERRRAYTRDLEDFREELDIARSEALDRVQRQVLEAIEIVAKQNGIDLVSENYIYASKRVDMTDLVLRYLQDVFTQEKNRQKGQSLSTSGHAIKAQVNVMSDSEKTTSPALENKTQSP